MSMATVRTRTNRITGANGGGPSRLQAARLVAAAAQFRHSPGYVITAIRKRCPESGRLGKLSPDACATTNSRRRKA